MPMNIRHEQQKGQSYCNISIGTNTIEYEPSIVVVLATIICTLNEQQANCNLKLGVQNIVTYTLKRAIKNFGQRATDAALKEMKQLLDRKCFVPVHADSLTPTER